MKKIFTLLLVVVMVFGLTACGKEKESSGSDTTSKGTEDSKDQDSKSSKGEEVLSFWVAPALISEEEQKMKQEDWYVSKIAKAFEAENPGVKVEITMAPDQNAMHQTFKAAATTDSGPDVVNLWSGQSIFTMSDIILDIKDMIPAEDKGNITGWETVTLDFKEGGPVLGYPVSGHEVCGFVYNKQILKEAGLDFDTNPPKTPEEFLSAMEKIKEKGYIPIAAADDGWNAAYFMSFASMWVQQEGSERVASNSKGETKFAEDEAFLKSYQFANELYTKGYINTDYLTIPSVDQLFLDGEAALLATGNWTVATAAEALGEENIGFCALPDVSEDAMTKNTAIGGPGQCLVISKNCKNPELAVKFASFINNKENHIELLKGLSKLPIRTDVTLEDVGMSSSGVYQQIAKLGENYVFWADNSMVPEVNAEMQKLGSLVITGKMTVEEMAAKLDEKAAELAK